MSKPKYVINDPRRLNIEFYEDYDPSFLYNKMRTILVALFNKEPFEKLLQESDPFHTPPDEKFYEGLRAELYFIEFHQFEAFLALILAWFQELPHWLYLSTYETKEIKEAAKNIIDGRFDLASKGIASNEDEFIRLGIYSGFDLAEEEEKTKWKEKRKRTAKLLKQLAQRYLDAVEYNSYKHGLRVMTNKSEFAITPDNHPEQVLYYAKSDDAISFLELEKDAKDSSIRITYRAIKHFNIVESINFIYAMHVYCEQIKKTRHALLNGSTDFQLSTVSVDEERLEAERTYFKFRMTV